MPPRFRRRARASVTVHEAFGVVFSLECADPGLRALALDVLPPSTTAAPFEPAAGDDPEDPAAMRGRFTVAVADNRHEVVLDGVALVTHASREVALGVLDAQVRLFVAARSPELVFVHAGVVEWRGRAIAVPGPSFSGKTTLVAALARAGAAYLSDEYAPLDAEGRVRPFPRPLSIRSRNGTDVVQHHPGQFGEVADAGSRVQLGAIVITSYLPGASFQPRVTTGGQGALALLANTVPAQERPRESLAAVARAASATVVLEGDRGEAEPAAAAILASLSRHWA